jgi:hypothetical protein
VPGICVHVEQATAGGQRERLDLAGASSFAHVDDALERRELLGRRELVCPAQLLSASER